LSNNGRRVVFLAADPANGGFDPVHGGFATALPQVWISNSDGSGLRQLTSESAGILEAVISGDGHKVFAITFNRAILSIDAEIGDVARLLDDSQVFDASPIVPGSRVLLSGAGLASADGHPLVRFDGIAAPLVSASPSRV